MSPQRIAAGAALVLALGGRALPAPAQEPRLFYEQDGTGTPVVFVADWAHTTGAWFRILPELRVPGRQLIRYDPRGQGRSEVPVDGAYGPDVHVRDLARLIEGLGLERTHLVGAGTGAATALEYARREPGRVISVTAVAPRIGWDASEREWWGRFLGAYDRVGRPTMGEYSSVLVGRWYASATVRREGWIDEYYDLMLRRQSAPALIESLWGWLSADVELGSSRVPVPVLVIRGESDPGGERDGEIRAAFPWFRRTRLTGVGLRPELEAPGALTAEVNRFLAWADGGAEGP